MSTTALTNRSKIRGFNLIEVLIASFILVTMALMVAAIVPTTLRTVRTANYYNLAAMVAQRKMEQLADPSISYANLTVASLAGDGTYPNGRIISKSTTPTSPCDWVDPAGSSTGTGPSGTSYAKTDYRLTGYFTTLDGLRKYKSDGSDACQALLPQNAFPGDSDVEGKILIEGWQGKTASVTDSSLLKVTITITWRTNGQGKSFYTTTALIPKSSIL